MEMENKMRSSLGDGGSRNVDVVEVEVEVQGSEIIIIPGKREREKRPNPADGGKRAGDNTVTIQ